MKPEEAIAEIRENGLYGNQVHMETLELALEALEKQVAKKPKGISVSHEGRLGNCPNPECNKLVWERVVHNNGCPECLQRLDWRKE